MGKRKFQGDLVTRCPGTGITDIVNPGVSAGD